MHCQKCRTPLKLDSSLEDLNPASLKLLTDSAIVTPSTIQYSASTRQSLQRRAEYDRVSRDARSPVFRRTVPPSRSSRDAAMSFIMLTESQVVPPSSQQTADKAGSSACDHQAPAVRATSAGPGGDLLSEKMETVNRLFEVLSARSDIDHPICVDCTDLLIEGLQKRLDATTKERDAYVHYLRQANADVPSEEERQQAQEKLEAARVKEQAALEELERLEKEKAELDEQLLALEMEEMQLDEEEEAFWRKRNEFGLTLSEFQNERDRINTRYDHDAKLLQRLQRTNVYNDTFYIGYDGTFGTINGLRLGKLSKPTVEWAEINAAWGQTCLLLQTLAEFFKFSFQGYKLNPMGSASTIKKLEYIQAVDASGVPQTKVKVKEELPLHYAGDLPLGFVFHSKFDKAMVAFLDCLNQLGQYVESSKNPAHNLKLPYVIEKDKIHGSSIRLGFGQEEAWTRACKHALTSCKYLLAHASNISNTQKKGIR